MSLDPTRRLNPLGPQPRHVAIRSRGHLGDPRHRRVAIWRAFGIVWGFFAALAGRLRGTLRPAN
eukprot:3399999-Pyramimonas_sp.AAC.1